MIKKRAPVTQGELEKLARMTHDEIVAVRSEVKQEFAAVRGEIIELRTEVREGFGRVDDQFSQIRVQLEEISGVLKEGQRADRRRESEIADLQAEMRGVKSQLKARAA